MSNPNFDEPEVPQDHLLTLTHLKFELTVPSDFVSDARKKAVQQEIIQIIETNKMVPYFKYLKKDASIASLFPATIKNQQQLEEELETKLKEFDAKIKDAEENLGESEVREALLAKANFYHNIGDKENALAQYKRTMTKTVAVGLKLDIIFSILRIAISFGDNELVRSNIEVAKNLIELGGDWERRNRLKVYEGTYLMSVRNFVGAAQLYLDSISTFSATEIMSYKTFIFYCLVVSMYALERPDLKKKIIESSDILTVIKEIPSAKAYVESLYNCQYQQYLIALADICDEMEKDRFVAAHVRYYSREMRIFAYSQFLESYKSVTLESMASQFGLSVAFLDKELASFIAAGRLTAKIDKVGGVIESTQRDAKNTHYANVIKQGDLLLNRVQKLSRVIDL